MATLVTSSHLPSSGRRHGRRLEPLRGRDAASVGRRVKPLGMEKRQATQKTLGVFFWCLCITCMFFAFDGQRQANREQVEWIRYLKTSAMHGHVAKPSHICV